MKKRIGLLGYGNAGKFLYEQLSNHPDFEVVFVWNRTRNKIAHLPENIAFTGRIDEAITSFIENRGKIDLMVEVAHPQVVIDIGELLHYHNEIMITSVTALANKALYAELVNGQLPVYVPAGAAWGLQDIQKMKHVDALESVHVTMQFNADALRVEEPLKSKLKDFIQSTGEETLVLFEGPVKELAAVAPNNVNSMMSISLAGLGDKETIGKLIATKNSHAHAIEIKVTGPNGFEVVTKRINPAAPGAVTGTQTYHSFLGSVYNAKDGRSGLNFV